MSGAASWNKSPGRFGRLDLEIGNASVWLPGFGRISTLLTTLRRGQVGERRSRSLDACRFYRL